MHKSKLGCLVIDCQTDDLDQAAEFWSKALGNDIVQRDDLGGDLYRGLVTDPSQPRILVQKVDHPSRVHLDIDSDNVEMEVERLIKLGATKIEYINDWCVMEAPSGHRFCIVKSKHPGFDDNAKSWDDN